MKTENLKNQNDTGIYIDNSTSKKPSHVDDKWKSHQVTYYFSHIAK